MNLSGVTSITIPEGQVRSIIRNDNTIWLWSRTVETDIYALATNPYWISTAGNIATPDKNWISSNKIPVTKGAVIRFALCGHPSVGNVVAYDTNGKVVGYAPTVKDKVLNETTYAVPKGATHITITGATETYTSNATKQYAFLVEIAKAPPRYARNGLVMWCDGINNTGNGHDDTVTTWVDLTGNGNDLINTEAKTQTVPSDTVKGEWTQDGIFIRATNSAISEYIRTVNTFDLGTDRTLEIRFTIVEDFYATFGFATGDRYKYRTMSNGAMTNDWTRYSASDTENVITHNLSKSAVVGVPSTMSIVRHYDSNADTTTYTVYLDGENVGVRSFAGLHREGEASHIILGNEKDVAIYHSVRLYDRALTSEEIATNCECDKSKFSS